jgi:hypothetical protein
MLLLLLLLLCGLLLLLRLRLLLLLLLLWCWGRHAWWWLTGGLGWLVKHKPYYRQGCGCAAGQPVLALHKVDKAGMVGGVRQVQKVGTRLRCSPSPAQQATVPRDICTLACLVALQTAEGS